ncbi:hypothetical protein HK405_002715 [Cladochytrium tenue]|nr:hypothetical protein HK405_002715 [Cladochytrium tenue]
MPSVKDATSAAIAFVQGALLPGISVGSGNGPLDHFHLMRPRAFGAGREPSLVAALIEQCRADWDAYVDHAFVRDLEDGTLPLEAFKHYICQDYVFLRHYTRAYALAAYKAPTQALLRRFLHTAAALADETELHVAMCERWDVGEAELAATREAGATLTYTRYVLELGNAGDALDLLVGLAPCLVGYGEIGSRLREACVAQRASGPDAAARWAAHPYREWIETYSGGDYQRAVREGIAALDELALELGVRPGNSRLLRLAAQFRQATVLEARFWDS